MTCLSYEDQVTDFREAARVVMSTRDRAERRLGQTALPLDRPRPPAVTPLVRGVRHTHEEIASEMGISARYVRLLEQRALRRLRIEAEIDPEFRSCVIAVLGRVP